MSLISRWDIRQESYANGANVTSLTDRQGTTNLTSNGGTSYPTYSSSENAISFGGSAMLGSNSLHAALGAVPASEVFSVFALVKQSSFGTGFIAGFSSSAGFAESVYLRDGSSGAVDCLVRNVDSITNSPDSTANRAADAWVVLHLCCDGANVKAGFGGSNVGSEAFSADMATTTFNDFALGALWRDPIAAHWTGFLREVRVYNTDESANLSSIVSDMQSGGTPSHSNLIAGKFGAPLRGKI